MAIAGTTFNGAINGDFPLSSLIEDGSGNLFGTTSVGGAFGNGTVFKVAAGTNTLTTLVSFNVATSGANPYAGLIEDSSGDLFGTTTDGGTSSEGTVFEVAAGTNTPITLASFNLSTGGVNPEGGLIEDSSGNLFGTTYQGGDGTVFEVAAGTHTLSTIASFSGSNGANPYGGLIEDSNGNLFGTTSSGGAYGHGTVFKVAAGTNKLITLVAFNSTDGANPEAGLIEDSSGNLFGTTLTGGASGYGTVFEVGVGDTLTTLASFNATNGAYPRASLVEDSSGNLFGTTESGGFNDGTVFKVAAGTNTLTTLVNFNNTNGSSPQAGLIRDSSGNLFGTTYGGGAYNHGTVFKVAAGTNTLTTLVSFDSIDGANPQAGLIEDSSGNLLGTTYGGGVADVGTVFEVTSGTITVQATDATGSSASQTFHLTIDSTPTITTTTLPNWTVNQPYNQTIVATGGTGPSNFTVTAGSLPAGLALNSWSGVIAGTPTSASGIFTITATDTAGASTSQAYSVNINAITTTSLTDNGPNPSVLGSTVSYTVNTTSVPNSSTVYLEDASNSNAVVGSVVVSGGSGSTTISNLSVGTHEIFALYTGASGYASSQSSQSLQTVNAIQVSTPVVNGDFAPIVDMSESGNTAMIVTDGNNGFSAGDQVVIAGEPGSAAGYNGTWTILSASGDTFTYADSATSLPIVTFDSNGYAISANSSSALVGKQRSMVDSVAYTFNTAVNLTAGAVTLGLASGVTTLGPATPATAVAGENWTSLGGGTTWVMTFSSATGNTVTGHSIADGVYTLSLNSADVTAVAGGSAMTTTRAADTFCRLYGEVTGGAGTQRVNGVDVTYFNDTYLLTDGAAGYLAALDYLGNGRVNANEIMPFTVRYLSAWSGFSATI